ncbi:MAG: LemA family protein [Candidatus Peribacteraceae bacterium]
MSMKKMLSPWVIILGVVVILSLWVVASYNGFIGGKANVDNAWAQVETQYQRRADLIPNLVASTKGAADFEQSTFTEVTAARSAWASAKATGTRQDQIVASQNFDSALSRLLVTVEAYPQLQATQAFRDLMVQLEGTENRVAVARKDFNDAVTAYNVQVKTVPGVFVARLFGFTPEQMFEAKEGADDAPVVDFQ